MKSLKKQNIDFPGTCAVGKGAIALGYATKTSNNYEVALGIMNESTSSFNGTPTLFSVGCGADGVRKNAVEVKQDGTTEFMGVGTIQSIEKRLKAVEKGGGGGGTGGNYLPLEEGGTITMEDKDTYHEILYSSDKIDGPLLASGSVVGYAMNKRTTSGNQLSMYSDAEHATLLRQAYSKYTTTYAETGVTDNTDTYTKVAYMTANSGGSAEVVAKRANGMARITSSGGFIQDGSKETWTTYRALQLVKDASTTTFSDYDISLMRCGDEVDDASKATLEFYNYMVLTPFSLSFKDKAIYGDGNFELSGEEENAQYTLIGDSMKGISHKCTEGTNTVVSSFSGSDFLIHQDLSTSEGDRYFDVFNGLYNESSSDTYYIATSDKLVVKAPSGISLKVDNATKDQLFVNDGTVRDITNTIGNSNANIDTSIPTSHAVISYVDSAIPNITAGTNVTVEGSKISVSTESSITDSTSTTAIPTVGAVKTYVATHSGDGSSTTDCGLTVVTDDTTADLNVGDASGNILLQLADGGIKTKNFDSSDLTSRVATLESKTDSSLRHLKVLIIGNSYSQDSWCYLPFMLKNYDITISVGISCIYGSSLQTHATSWTSNSSTFFYIDTRTDSAWKTVGTYSSQNIVKYTDWDIILLQQQSTASVTESTYQPYAHTLVGYILDATTKPVKIGWNININPASAGDDYTAIAKQILANIKTVTDAEPVNFIAPYGTAVFNARTNETLAAIGDGGNLWASDKLHLQEGLPCYLANLTSMQALFDMFYPWLSVLGETTRPTQTMINTWGIPGQNGTCTGVSDEACRLAQYCAIAANKDKFNITTIS